MESTPLFIGIDVGTGGCKVAAHNCSGQILASAYKEYRVLHPQPGWAEQDPEDWWRAAREALVEVVSAVGADSVEALSVTSQREAFAPIDKEGRVLYNAIIWLDSRATRQEKWIAESVGARAVYEATGLPVHQIFSAAKLLWLKEEVPSIFQGIWRILFAKDYVAYKLTGEVATDYSMASRTLLFDVQRLEWLHELCERMGIPLDILPPLKGSWEVVGEVTAEAAAVTGLRKGVPLVAGGGDRPCEALGAGALEEGEVNVGTGTGTCFEVPLAQPRLDPRMRVDTCAHVVPSRWEYEIVVNATGESLRWLRDNLGHWEVEEAKRRGASPYNIMMEEAASVPPGSEGLLYYPYLWGAAAPVFNPKARGTLIGLSHSHTRAHIIRAVLEGVAYHYGGVVELVRELGVEVKRVTMTGGEARGRLWNAIKAAVLGLPLHLPEVLDAASLGAAMLAAVGTRHFTSFGEAVSNMVRISTVVEPEPDLISEYNRLYERYWEVCRVIEGAFNT